MSRVLWVSELYPTREDPGRAAYLWPLLSHLRRRVQVDLALLVEPGLEPDFTGLDPAGVEHIPIPSVRTWKRVWLQTLLARDVPRRLAALKPGLIHAQFGAPSGVLAAKSGIPFVVTVRGTDANTYLQSPILTGMMRKALGRAERVVAVSGSVAETLRAAGVPGDRIVVVHNGVDTSAFRPRDRAECRRALGLPAEGRLILYVGHFLESKGLRELDQAMKGLDARLALVGAGDWRPPEGSIRAGPRPRSEMPLWMGASDLLCLPSHAEGRPNVVLEALASGRPVVATRVGAVPELVDASSGIVIPPRNPEALAGALKAVLSKDWDPAAISAKVSDGSWEASADRLAELYEGILARNHTVAPGSPAKG